MNFKELREFVASNPEIPDEMPVFVFSEDLAYYEELHNPDLLLVDNLGEMADDFPEGIYFQQG